MRIGAATWSRPGGPTRSRSTTRRPRPSGPGGSTEASSVAWRRTGDRIVATGGSDSRTRLWEVSQLAGSGPSPRPLAVLETSGRGHFRRPLAGREPGRDRAQFLEGQAVGSEGTTPGRSRPAAGPDHHLRALDRSGRMLAVGGPGPRHGALGSERSGPRPRHPERRDRSRAGGRPGLWRSRTIAGNAELRRRR